MDLMNETIFAPLVWYGWPGVLEKCMYPPPMGNFEVNESQWFTFLLPSGFRWHKNNTCCVVYVFISPHSHPHSSGEWTLAVIFWSVLLHHQERNPERNNSHGKKSNLKHRMVERKACSIVHYHFEEPRNNLYKLNSTTIHNNYAVSFWCDRWTPYIL